MQLVPITQAGTALVPLAELASVVSAVLQATAAMYGRTGYEPPWIGYLATEGGRCVGTCGFNGPPKDREVEIAYFTFAGNEGAGVATRMASALIEITRSAESVHAAVYAHTLPEESASTAILRRLRFTFVGEVIHPEDGKVWKWRLNENAEA